jgi:lysophospholipase L1-like esterase
MRKFAAFLSCLLWFAACTPVQPETPPQEPDVPVTPEVPEVIDYGDGSKERPFVIDNTARLEEFMNVYKDAAQPADKNAFKFYACMIADVDASEIDWTPLNAGGSFYKAIDFDGKGHTISNLKASGTYASFTGVLYGSVRNVTFSNATINGGSANCGVVAGFLGTNGLAGSCENVVVTNSTVTGTRYVGGFAGVARTTGSVTGCRVENTTLTSTSYIAGFAAYVDLGSEDKYEVPAIFRDCHVSDVTINQNNTAGGDVYTAGFVGFTSYGSSFIDCSVKATIVADKAASADKTLNDVGGFLARSSSTMGPTCINSHVLEGTTITAKATRVGGFVGYSEVASTYNGCSSAAVITNAGNYTGGFAGFACGSSMFKDCSASGNVTGVQQTGGFVGYAENAGFTDSKFEKGTVTSTYTGKTAQSAGFCGYATKGVSFNGCLVDKATVSAPTGQRIGGFVGQLGANYNAPNNITLSQCGVKETSVTGALNTGGFVGVQYEGIDRSYVSGGKVTAKGNNCGGFSAYVQQGGPANCYTTADVEGGSYSAVGGFAGVAYVATLSSCYAAGTVQCSGSNVGAFVGQCSEQNGGKATIENCIGWHATLPFYGVNEVGATITNCYAGAQGTVSSQASSLGWNTSAWDLSASVPVLLQTPRRIAAAFIGDSITWQWARNSAAYSKTKYPMLVPFDSRYMTDTGETVTVTFHPGFFSGNNYVDRGVSGQNTTQMLARFDKDIVDLNPQVVVIMGGTNDLAQGVTKKQILANLTAMAEKADAAGIKVVLCSVTPCNDNYSKLSPKNKGPHIVELNGMIKEYVDSKGFAYCNYWPALVADDQLALHPNYCLYDRLHPGPDGYDVMEAIIKPIIDSLL